MICSPQLRIGYINVQGLSSSKLDKLSALMPSSFDILFLAETWYINHDAVMAHPLSFLSTPIPVSTQPTAGHLPHGMLCLLSPSLRPLISTFSSSEFHLVIHLPGVILTAVYLPPPCHHPL